MQDTFSLRLRVERSHEWQYDTMQLHLLRPSTAVHSLTRRLRLYRVGAAIASAWHAANTEPAATFPTKD